MPSNSSGYSLSPAETCPKALKRYVLFSKILDIPAWYSELRSPNYMQRGAHTNLIPSYCTGVVVP